MRANFLRQVRCGARTIHVSGTGDDNHPGTALLPMREINRAVLSAEPGDLILVDSGTYGYTEVRDFIGQPEAWLAIMSLNDKVDAQVWVPPPTDNFFNVINSSYVGIYGLHVRGNQDNPNTNGSGISIYGNSHNVSIWNNRVHDFPGGGINCFDSDGSHDLIDISNNTIYSTSKWSPWNTSGISIFASKDLRPGGLLRGGYGYRIVNNYIYDVECRVPFTPGGFEFITDGNAVSLDLVRDTYNYTKPILVAGNIMAGCGGRAVHANETVNVIARNNQVVGNMRTVSPAISGQAELDGTTNKSVQFIDNVVLPTNTSRVTDQTSLYRGNVFLGGSQEIPRGNHNARDTGSRWFAGHITKRTVQRGLPRGAFGPAASAANSIFVAK